jgi:hypothetical protein
MALFSAKGRRMSALMLFAVSYTTVRVAWLLLALSGSLGLMALISPRCFHRVSAAGSRWVDTTKLIERLDRRFDVDRYILPYSRVLGALVVASVAVLALLLTRR